MLTPSFPGMANKPTDIIKSSAEILTNTQTKSVNDPSLNQPPIPCTNQDFSTLPWLEKTHQRLSQRLCDKIEKLDLFFGNIQYEDEYPTSFIRVRNAIIWNDSHGNVVKLDPHINARIRLPALQNRFNLLLSDEDEDRNALSTSRDNVRFENENKSNQFSTALRWIAQQTDRMEINLDAGFRGLDPFVRARYRDRWNLSEQQQIRLLQEVFWKNSERFGERTELNYDQTLSPLWLFRITSVGTFSEVSEGIDWTQQFSFLQTLDSLRAITYTAALTGHTREHFIVDDYGFGVRYRKNIYHSWLYAEIEPQVNWPYEFQRSMTQTIIFRLEAQFGKP